MKSAPSRHYIELKARCEAQMQLEVCDGCDACGLRCAAGVPASREEWEALQAYLAGLSSEERAYVEAVLVQDKSVSLGDGVTVRMCRYRDMERGRCTVYPARPLMCRLLGHVEWMPCPIARVSRPIPTADALALMRAYADCERRTFEEWEADPTATTPGSEEPGADQISPRKNAMP
ncbi:MAG TPA: YkgJ family cysteine cluster protein [Chthonomonadaceae bacterium]|nr:YkgJ family cysteine cluster protein [Chthonomonadaceae bacterium]